MKNKRIFGGYRNKFEPGTFTEIKGLQDMAKVTNFDEIMEIEKQENILLATKKLPKPGKLEIQDLSKAPTQTSIYFTDREQFVDTFEDVERTYSYNKEKHLKITSTKRRTKVIHSGLDSQMIYHKNYLDYLRICWNNHYGIVFRPDIVWYTLLCELATIVKNSPERYRSLFTTSDEQQNILVQGDEVLPLGKVVHALQQLCPTDIDTFLPKFSTTSAYGVFASYAAFCDMCSPYYSYSMYCCGIPRVDIRGTRSDYEHLIQAWDKVTKLMESTNDLSNNQYFKRVHNRLQLILDNLENPEFWKGIFSHKRCGSGSQFEVNGWWTEFYREVPSIKFLENYPTNVSVVKYDNISTKRNFEMSAGLFQSDFSDDQQYLEPEFSYVVTEVLKTPEQFTTEQNYMTGNVITY